MKIRYKFGVWMLCLMFPALVWAENAKSICTSFTQQGRQVTLQSFRGKNLVLAGREAATEKRFLCRDQ